MDGNRKWDEQHRTLYNHLRGEDTIELLKKLIRYRNAKNDPHLAQYPPDMIKKTIDIIEYILTEEQDIADINQEIEDAIAQGAI